jgi:hypothetical protein
MRIGWENRCRFPPGIGDPPMSPENMSPENMSPAHMSPAKFVVGCCVLLAALGGLVVSNHVVNAMIPMKSSRVTKSATVQPKSPIDTPVTGEHPYDANAEAAIPTGRLCTDLDGKIFGWNWPNVPFGTATCSDAGRKAGK